MRFLLIALLANIALLPLPVFGDTKFHVVDPSETSLPQNTFVFAVQNIETGIMHFGYATEAPSDPKRRVNTLLPGHSVLMAHDLGVSDEEFLKNHLPKFGEGKHVCGGFFVLGNQLYVHPFYSSKGAGQIEPSVAPSEPVTGNPMLPIQNSYNGSFIPPPYLASFLSGILRRFRMPFALDLHLLNESPHFSWNKTKHAGTEIVHELNTDLSARAFKKTVIAVNLDILGMQTRIVPAFPSRVRASCSRFLMALRAIRETYKQIRQFRKEFEGP